MERDPFSHTEKEQQQQVRTWDDSFRKARILFIPSHPPQIVMHVIYTEKLDSKYKTGFCMKCVYWVLLQNSNW